MKPDSTSYENILEVENWGSQLSTFYKIMSPVQITLESCTGLGETDQYSIQMFSPNGCWLHENSMDALFRALSSRPLHRHDYFELMLVLEGEVIQQIEEKEYPYRAGTCCLVNRSILHNERFIGPAKLCFLGLSVDFVRSLKLQIDYGYYSDGWMDEHASLTVMAGSTGEIELEFMYPGVMSGGEAIYITKDKEPACTLPLHSSVVNTTLQAEPWQLVHLEFDYNFYMQNAREQRGEDRLAAIVHITTP